MSHGHHHHQPHHHHDHDHEQLQSHHGQGDPHHHDFFTMEDILRREFELRRDKVVEFLKKAGLKEGQRVLELGCGFAPLLELYLDTVGPSGHVTLSDPEPRLADRLAPRLSGRPNARFVPGRAEELLADGGAAGEAYDVAVMSNVYHHLTDPESVLAALRRRLRPPSGRLIVLDFVHDTLRLFSSPAATPAAAKAQQLLARLIRPEASPVTAVCAARLRANGFAVRLSETYVLQDRLNGSQLGEFYSAVMIPRALERLVRRGWVTQAERAECLTGGLAALREDPEATLFSEIQVMLAADAV